MEMNEALDLVVLEIKKSGGALRPPGADSEPMAIYLQTGSKHLESLKRDITLNKYQPRPLKRMLVAKQPKSSPREIYYPTNRDHLVARAVSCILKKNDEVYKQPSASVVASSAVADINKYPTASILKIDIKSFFDAISSKMIDKVLKRKKLNEQVRRIVALFGKARVWKTGDPVGVCLPQGVSFSPWIANDIGNDLANELKSVKGVVEVRRYVDDMIITLNRDGRFGRGTYRRYLSDLLVYRRLIRHSKRWGFEMHPIQGVTGKTRFVVPGMGFDFLGFHVETEGSSRATLRIPERAILSEKSKIRNLFNSHVPSGFRVIRGATASGVFSNVMSLRTLKYKIELRSLGWKYRSRSYGFCNYYAIVDNPRDFILLDRYVKKMCRQFSIPEFDAGYERAFKKIRGKEFRPHFFFDFDSMTIADLRNILVSEFGYHAQYISSISDRDISFLWNRVISREIRSVETLDMRY